MQVGPRFISESVKPDVKLVGSYKGVVSCNGLVLVFHVVEESSNHRDSRGGPGLQRIQNGLQDRKTFKGPCSLRWNPGEGPVCVE